ncbi:MAG TPA: hypothetical protein VH478_19190 [Trebonia sp.]|nr:hypothetical protein [Trebonia sp.]
MRRTLPGLLATGLAWRTAALGILRRHRIPPSLAEGARRRGLLVAGRA